MPEIETMGFVPEAGASAGPKLEAFLQEGQQVTLQVSGDSMRPTLKPRRDAVLLTPIQGEAIQKGDILLFRSERSPSGYSLHRAVRVSGDQLTMNGDAQGWTEQVSAADVLAKAIVLLRKGKPVDAYSIRWRLFAAVWGVTRPFRFGLFAAWRKIKQIVKK